MKNIWKILAVIFVILFCIIFFRENYLSRIYHRLSSPKHTLSDTESLYKKYDCKNKIVFIGDSLTMNADWSELLDKCDVVNRGLWGDTTNKLLKRLDFYLSQTPKCIFIMIGVNDSSNMDTIKTNYSKIIDKILNNNVQLFIQSTLYTDRADVNKRIEILNNYLVEQCKLKSIQYIDVNGRLSENKILSPKYSNDGLHLNGDGYIIWKQVILPYVNKLQ